jgi:hypothetical protein
MRRLTGRAAIGAWSERLAVVRAEPTDENLQRLCTLLDAVDAWVVRQWGEPGHDERRSTLAAMRAEAWANRLVSDALRETGRRRAEETNRKRATARPSAVASAARSPVPRQGTTDRPAAA